MAMSDDDLKIVASARQMEADIIMGRLADAGIRCMHSPGLGGYGRGMPQTLEVYVNANDLERARAVLKEDEGGFDEQELARLSEEAGRQNPVDP
jgi:Putative prokaryotic signal transducing protein